MDQKNQKKEVRMAEIEENRKNLEDKVKKLEDKARMIVNLINELWEQIHTLNE